MVGTAGAADGIPEEKGRLLHPGPAGKGFYPERQPQHLLHQPGKIHGIILRLPVPHADGKIIAGKDGHIRPFFIGPKELLCVVLPVDIVLVGDSHESTLRRLIGKQPVLPDPRLLLPHKERNLILFGQCPKPGRGRRRTADDTALYRLV